MHTNGAIIMQNNMVLVYIVLICLNWCFTFTANRKGLLYRIALKNQYKPKRKRVKSRLASILVTPLTKANYS